MNTDRMSRAEVRALPEFLARRLLGGGVAKYFGTTAVFGVCAALVVLWLLLALGMWSVPAVNEVSRAAL